MTKRLSILAVATGLLCLVSAPAWASSIVFSNLGPGNSFTSSYYGIEGASSASFGEIRVAMGFTPTETYLLTQIDLGVRYVGQYSGGVNQGMTITLTKAASGIPGALLESWNLTTPLFNSSLKNVVSAGGVTLTAGETYFITAAMVNPLTAGGWYLNNQGVTGAFATTYGCPAWCPYSNVTLGAFAVQGNLAPVPEPGSLTLLGVGLISLARSYRQRRSRSR